MTTTPRVILMMLGATLTAASARAHFVWVTIEGRDAEPRAHVYFGEAAEPDSAEFLDRLTRLKAWRRSDDGEYQPLELKKIETDDGGMLAGPLPGGISAVEAECLYGVFSRGGKSMLLHYYAKALSSQGSPALAHSSRLPLDVAPALAGGVLRLVVTWNGKPAEGAQVFVSPPKGETSELTTGAGGIATVKASGHGRYEIRARLVETKAGEFEKEKYDESRHYCTVTFDAGAEAGTGEAAGTAAAAPAEAAPAEAASADGEGSPTTGVFPRERGSGYADLPRGITSFGAAVIGDSLYVYGGHFGEAHKYSDTSQSDELSRLDLTAPAKWEVIAEGPRLQGLAMVAHGGKLYRMGGFTAHNKEGEEHDLRSVADFVRFDPRANQWEELPPLPEPRSSHDAVLIGDALYVAGGWRLGGDDPVWHETAWVVDLTREPLQWKGLPAPPFRRRALSLGHLKGRLYAIGGMQPEGGPTTRVDVLDLASGEWSEGPSLIGAGMEGFGSSACAVGERLFVSTYRGNLQFLDGASSAWRIATELEDDRFFHRMLLFHDRLLLVGGASMKSGQRRHLETVELSRLE